VTHCDYFSLYDADTGSLTEWGAKLRRGYEGEVSAERRLDIEYGRLTYREVFEREGVDRATLETDDDAIDPQTLLKAEATRRSAGIPVTCPHEPVGGGSYCKFHLPPERYDEHDLTREDVCASFIEIINGATGTDAQRTKCFAGAQFEQIALPYRTLTSTSNRPVQLQYAEIGTLDLDDTVVDERLELDGARIESLSCEHARFRRSVSFERAELDCQAVSFDNTVFEERVSFCGADVSATKLEFENCSFESECEFRDVAVELELAGADPSMIPIVFNQTRFADSFDCSGGEFYVGDEVGRRTQVGVEFIQCHFGDETKFGDCTFGRTAESNSVDEFGGWYDDTDADDSDGETADVEWNLSFDSSVFAGRIQFDEAEIAGHLNLKHVDFSGKIGQFDDMEIDGKLRLNGAEFSQGDIDFSDTVVRGNGSEVSGRCMNCRETSFGRGDLDFEDAEIDGDVVFTQASFGQGSLNFEGVDVDGEARLDQTSFSGKRAAFGRLTVGGSLTLQGAVYSVTGGTIEFEGMTVEGGANFRQTTFTGNNIDFGRITIHGEAGRSDDWQPPINFRETTWQGGRIDFSNAEMGAGTTYDLATFSGEQVVFTDATVRGDLTLQHVTFNTIETVFTGLEVLEADTFDMSLAEFNSNRSELQSMALACDEAITFEEATFESDTDFSGLEARHAETFDMSRTYVGGNLIFDDAVLACGEVEFSRLSGESAMLEFRRVTSDDAEIRFEDATVLNGSFEVDGETVYNFEGATIGDINIGHEGDGKLFEHFVFRDTEFDGFDFSKNDVKKELKQTGWRIHTSHRGGLRTGFPNTRFDFLRRWSRLIKHGPDDDSTHPEQLESTYMKAKLGADQQGDPDTVSQFFQKELHFRRHTYGYQFWERSAAADPETNRLGLAWDWIANMTLALTVGYGERPSNVVLTSVVVVFLFSFVYRGLDALPTGSTYIDYLTYSLQGFIQLVVGIQPAGDVLVRLFTSIEGFIGAFVIALFVITLTRSIDR